MVLITNEAAEFSPDRMYRYTLWRVWRPIRPQLRYAMFIGLNPSTADEVQDDPTVRRCINYAKSWGYEAMVMTNLFGYRATDPREMKVRLDPVGPDNNRALLDVGAQAGVVVAAWGTHGSHLGRDCKFTQMWYEYGGQQLMCLKTTKKGHPSHPLYLKKDLTPVPWREYW